MTAEDDVPLMLSQSSTAQPEFSLVSEQERCIFQQVENPTKSINEIKDVTDPESADPSGSIFIAIYFLVVIERTKLCI